ncbi:hypothetical protein [Shewanella phaeophyticola]|uniref:Uncharacterized protein n=1 Tax=Shewanella phaeophyticola TaxID=2978345 RepID=A0ABT2P1P5_9GAMM|nr:hypothetical protein [Shewanella sp. KJ10-1]MCT8986578.1 hypothetical protein [Shewanella sp. KJ10-1]
MFANQGEEYDELIKIEKLESKDEYRFSLPRIVGESNGWPTLTLIYSSHQVTPDCKDEILPDRTQLICGSKDQFEEKLILDDFWSKSIDWVYNKKLYEGEFKIQKRKNYSIELNVMWETEVCLTFGRKSIIE